MEKEFKGTTIMGVEKVDDEYIENAVNPKEFNLSEKECNILINEVLPPEWGSIEDKEGIKLIVENKDNLTFKKGFFTENIKEFIRLRDGLDKLLMLKQITRQEHADRCDKLAGDKFR